jgi:hypothetical protein
VPEGRNRSSAQNIPLTVGILNYWHSTESNDTVTVINKMVQRLKLDKKNVVQKHQFCICFTSYPLTLCHSYLNLYCLGRKTAFFPVGI